MCVIRGGRLCSAQLSPSRLSGKNFTTEHQHMGVVWVYFILTVKCYIQSIHSSKDSAGNFKNREDTIVFRTRRLFSIYTSPLPKSLKQASDQEAGERKVGVKSLSLHQVRREPCKG